jgi:hypothetical protein
LRFLGQQNIGQACATFSAPTPPMWQSSAVQADDFESRSLR